MFSPQLIACLVIQLTVSVSASEEKFETIVLDTKLGSVKGLMVKDPDTGEDIYKFQGIRYGKPPIGPLRFKPPEKVDVWTETYDATTYGSVCHQFLPEEMAAFKPPKVDEDCLFLNIFLTQLPEKNTKRSVMVWIHGGGLMNGHGDLYDGGWLALQGDVIVVTLNYRLGIFGFLALDHPAALGNYGIWDQKLALQWIHENIEAFGGDPNSVTIFGESAGGWSVSFQSLIPSNKGLFQRVIAQSGVVTQSGVLNKEMINDAFEDLSRKVDCPVQDMYKFVNCLRDIDAEKLNDIADYFAALSNESLSMNTQYQVAVDGELYTDNPLVLLSDVNSEVSKFFKSLDFMAGTTSNEGNLLPASAHRGMQIHYGFNITESVPAKFLYKGLVDPFVKKVFNNDANLKKSLYKFYTSDVSEDDQSLKVTEFLADMIFVYPTTKMLEYHAQGSGGTYQYLFSHESATPINVAGPMPKWFQGVGHGEELPYIFNLGSIIPHLSTTEEEKRLSRMIIQYWTSFAKTG